MILDVAYNHSAEGNHLGPTFCFKEIENVHYYRLIPWEPRYYMDYSGCGNTLDATKPRVLQMITDSLRPCMRCAIARPRCCASMRTLSRKLRRTQLGAPPEAFLRSPPGTREVVQARNFELAI